MRAERELDESRVQDTSKIDEIARVPQMMVSGCSKRKRQQQSKSRYRDALTPSNGYGSTMNHDTRSLYHTHHHISTYSTIHTPDDATTKFATQKPKESTHHRVAHSQRTNIGEQGYILPCHDVHSRNL